MAWGTDPAVPNWVVKAIVDRRDTGSGGPVEEATYRGDRVFVLHGDREDQTLFAANGSELCRFGGIVGAVTAGDCDVGQIHYVRTLYDRERR
jgi:hypothetical protein